MGQGAGMRMVSPGERLTLLGVQSPLPESPTVAKLEVAANPHADSTYVARFTAPEFTSLCPVTGQPDFARFVIDYVPDQWIIESKSLKLFLGSFRNHAAFHEDCTVMIGKRLRAAAEPIFIRVCAFWAARGGIPIDVFWQDGAQPINIHLPDPGYRRLAGGSS